MFPAICCSYSNQEGLKRKMERNVDTRVINCYLESCHSPPLTKGTKGRIASSPCIGVYGHGSFHKVKSNLRFYSPHTSVENKSY